ncbi:SDR family NAD(P)-dependent oxidoreductase [Arthrobacter sp. EH-1B-1]|uniref:SDR family NAD(P)-dependent oxidoreductase n=1 Tax=Arthrobacter vasquezii TaxID=2977629 RepID=A0ABT6CZ14_9MICC|nr:SDR family NAD(P)-dependent oxidoreductase [Arthrobacter vasquezii]MDF9279140.1 SDR family NAD(P)-dependent oxidoreductase [Arthrobacter vasquezii]
MAFTVRGRTVLITGAGMGMGKLYAERAVREGAAAVVLWDIDETALQNVAAGLASSTTTVHTNVVDVASVESITAAAESVLNDVGAPDVLINNAGIVRGKYFWDHDHHADIDLTLQINTGGLMHVTREFLPAMMERGTPARILNVASASGTLSVPRMSVYAASKWAVIGWSDSLRLELKSTHHPIAVTTLIPSYIKTGMFEGARGPLLTPLMEPDYVVDKAWRATLAGKARVQLPWTVQLAGTLRNVLPQPAWDFVADRVFKVYSSMDHFTGRPTPAITKDNSR